MTPDLLQQLRRAQRRLLIAALIGSAACALGYWLTPAQFFQSYLLSVVFWIGVSLGCMVFVMIHHLVGGAWGFPVRRILESGAWPLVFMILLFAPLLLGMEHLYEWADPEIVAQDELLQHKAAYLNVWGFFGYAVRAVLYFLIWGMLAFLLSHWSLQHDRLQDPALDGRLRAISALGLVLYGLTATFASFDWMMSLEPHWFSSMYGVIVMAGQGVAGLAFGIFFLVWLSDYQPLASFVKPGQLQDLGNLLLASIAVWMYVAFSQYLIIWSGNLPEELPWYVRRSAGGWEWVGLALVGLHFAGPFLLLMMREVKRNAKRLGAVAGLLIVMHLVDVFWLMMPAFYDRALQLHWLTPAAFITVGAIWLMIVLSRLQAGALLPQHELQPREIVSHE